MNKLWTESAAAEATGGRAKGRWNATGVSIDSRTIRPGDLFVALRGKTRDAHAYVSHARAAGAAAAVVDRPVEGPHLLVADTGQALTALAIAARARSVAKIAAITGSVGKTSSKEALTQLLAAQAPTYGSEGNLNNELGVPLSLARLPEMARFGIFELGMSRPGEIAPLARWVKPHVALITAIAPTHVAFFADGEAGIALEKASIAEGLLPGGILILPYDSEYFPQMRACHSEVLTFGASSKADSYLLDWRPESDGVDRIEAMILGQRCHYHWGMAGRHQALNSLAVLTALLQLGGDLSQALHDGAALRSLAGHGDRLRLPWQGGMVTLLDESYNASPTAVRAALAVLAGLPARRLLILGDMLELGERADAWHESLVDSVNAGDFDRIYLVGSHVAALARALPKGRVTALASQTEELIPPVLSEIEPGDALLIKGSADMKLRSLVEAIKTASKAQKVRSDVL